MRRVNALPILVSTAEALQAAKRVAAIHSTGTGEILLAQNAQRCYRRRIARKHETRSSKKQRAR
jgi:hypothetical protein